MYSSKIFTALAVLTFVILIGILVLQALEMRCYEMF